MSLTRLIARPMLASTFVNQGIKSLNKSQMMAQRSQPVTERVASMISRQVPALAGVATPENVVRANAAIHIGAGLALATGRAPRTSAALLAATLVPTTFGAHRFWEESDPATRTDQRVHFFKNLSMLGGLLIAAVDTDGQPGLAWRAKHAVHDAQRETRHLTKAAQAQVRLAAKALPTP